MIRSDSREAHEIRPITLTRNYLPQAEGSCYIEMGMTRIITTASIMDTVPPWLIGRGSGWVTAEYGMLPRATNTRSKRPASSGKPNGRSMEIQRLIGRALRAVTNLKTLGERSIYVDCDVINADGGTRCASIIGAAVALHDAGSLLKKNDQTDGHIMEELVGAVSVGILKDEIYSDLCYVEDSSADVDMNVVMTESGGIIEVQGTAEGEPFDREMLDTMMNTAQNSIESIIAIQKRALGI